MKKKKLLTLLCVFALSFSMAACSDNTEKDGEETRVEQEKEEQSSEESSKAEESVKESEEGSKEADVEASLEETEEVTGQNPGKEDPEEIKTPEVTKPAVAQKEGYTVLPTGTTVKEYELPEFNVQATVEETVLLDQDGYKVILNSMDTGEWNVCLHCTVISQDSKKALFDVERASINGYTMDVYGYQDMEEAGSYEIEINISRYDLLEYDIEEIGTIGLLLNVVDGESFDDILEEYVVFETSKAPEIDLKKDTGRDALKNGFWYTYRELETTHYYEGTVTEASGASITCAAILQNDNKTRIMFEAENTTDEYRRIRFDKVSVNGMVISNNPYYSIHMLPETKALQYLEIEDLIEPEYLAAMGIDEISTVEMEVSYTGNGYFSDLGRDTIRLQLDGRKGSVNTSGKEVFSKDGLRLIDKGLMMEPLPYSDDMAWVFLIENKTGSGISFSADKTTITVNGTPVSGLLLRIDMNNDEYAFARLVMEEASLAEAGVEELEELKEITIQLSAVTDEYQVIMDQEIKATFN